MLLGVARPTAIAGVVLHDIGPVIEPTGLARIKSYVGKLPQPRSFAEGAEILSRLASAQFPKLSAEQWLAYARRTWQTDDGELAPRYDARLARTLSEVDIERPLPPLWNEFDALAGVPLLVIRGANSDILSAATVTAMQVRHPDMQVIEVPDQGHVPLLEGQDLLGHVARFVAGCEPSRPAAIVAKPGLAAKPAAE
jgi:pimeloyl-ACP methyl ester carboxylesterase